MAPHNEASWERRPCVERESFFSARTFIESDMGYAIWDGLRQALRDMGATDEVLALLWVDMREDPCHHGLHIDHIGRRPRHAS